MYCFDANIWVYYFDTDLPEHSAVVDHVRDALRTQPLFTTTVLQMEVVHYLHTQHADASSAIDRFLGLEDVAVAELRPDDVETAVEILEAHPGVGIGGRDATIIATMKRHNLSQLWTHDTALLDLGDRLDWLYAVDPVETDPEL
jgi:predicted nucleic acid-binding protein